MLRKSLFWMHLIAGCTAGLVILIMSVTGVLLAYQRQMIGWCDRNYQSSAGPGIKRLPVDSLIAGINGDTKPSGITIRANASAPAEVSFGRERVVLVDVYSGKILGESASKLRPFLAKVEEVHRWLAVDVAHRATGRGITGAANLAFLMLVVSGPFLWIPRKWNRQNVRAVALLRWNVRGKARDYNWHNVIGIWSVVPLFVIVVSGVVMSYPWANNLVYLLTGTTPPVQSSGPRPGVERRNRGERPHGVSDAGALDPLFLKAEAKLPDWRSVSLRLPQSGRGLMTFTVDTADNGRPDKRSQLTLNPRTGDELRWEPFSSYNNGRQVRVWLRFLHTGEALGWVGQTVAALASAGAAVLVWTGLFLAGRRAVRWNSRRREMRSKAVAA